MDGSVNKVTLIGNLGADPDIRSSQRGDKIASFSIATSESWTDKNSGERRERTEWHRISTFGGLAELAERYLRKGDKVYVEGKLQTRKWTDQEGQERWTTEVALQPRRGEIVFLSNRRGDGGTRSSGGSDDWTPADGNSDLDDEIPF